VVKGTVTISIEDFQAFLESAEKANEIKDNFKLATKELQVFLSFLATRTDLEKYIDEFNRQSKTSKIVFEGTVAKIEVKND
tara:strand:- start:89 stop:331 length:243 start_codon:yes stop_codon:yes gene_type:complete